MEYTSNRFGSADLLLDKAEAAELFRETGFFAAEQRYTAKSGAADYYSYVLTVQVEFDVKSVGWVDAWASNEPMPSELGALQLHLESIVESARKQAGPSGDALQKVVTIAKDFLVQTSTFRFDGIPETLRVADAVTLESFPEQHIVTITFDSRHAGYGDRQGQILLQVITPHVARVKVVRDNVVSVILDERWDELSQKSVGQACLATT
ncbi:MAG: hypothetical protein HYU39_08325 [Thaumarchaeota archaeon]|nr:hypothetical protein [Nitrososphaerota archaeon]